MKRLIASCFALSVLMVSAQEKTPIYGRTGTASSLKNYFSWFADPDGNVASSITPWSVNSNDYKFVIVTTPKKLSTDTFPDVEFHWAGDGATAYPLGGTVNCNCNTKITFPNAYLYGGVSFMGNSGASSVTKFDGVYRIVPLPGKSSVYFNAANVRTGVDASMLRGVGLYGKFIGDADTFITFDNNLGNYDVPQIAQFEIMGDMSEFSGKVKVKELNKLTTLVWENHDPCGRLIIGGATALGNPAAPCADAISIGRGFSFEILNNVVQGNGRDITLSMTGDTEFDWVRLRADGGSDWTLATPVHGDKGHIEKGGAGNVTLASSLEVKSVVVREGTLTIGDAAVFAEGTTITVKPGAHVVCARGVSVPNVTFVVEPGAKFAIADFTVPFDGTTTAAIDCTGSSAEDFAITTKPIDIMLSDYVPMPQNETNRFAVATFNAALGVQAGDFADASPKHFGYLPTTWFEVETEGDISTVYLVAKPMITRIAPPDHNWRPIHAVFATDPKTAESTEGTTDVYVWSDHLAAHPGADYVHTNKGYVTSWINGDWSGITRKFMGDSLYISGSAIGMKSGRVEYDNLVIGSGSGFNSINGSPNLHVFDGTYELRGPLGLSGTRENYGDVHLYELAADLSGTGKLTLGAVTNAFVGKVSGTSPEYKGDVEITNSKTASGPGDGTTIEVGNKFSLGGELDAFKTNALTLHKFSMVRPVESMTMDVMTRGIFIGGTSAENGAGFDVPEGVALEVKQPIKMGDRKEDQTFNTTLFKTGAGALKLNGEITFGFSGMNLVEGGNNVLEVREGFLKAADSREVGPARMQVRFAEGAGIEVGAGGGDGVFAAAIAQESPIAVRLDTSDMTPDGKTIVTPVCTVPQDNVDLTFAIAKPEGLSGYNGKLKKVALYGDDAGLVRYDVSWEFAGTVVIFR